MLIEPSSFDALPDCAFDDMSLSLIVLPSLKTCFFSLKTNTLRALNKSERVLASSVENEENIGVSKEKERLKLENFSTESGAHHATVS